MADLIEADLVTFHVKTYAGVSTTFAFWTEHDVATMDVISPVTGGLGSPHRTAPTWATPLSICGQCRMAALMPLWWPIVLLYDPARRAQAMAYSR